MNDSSHDAIPASIPPGTWLTERYVLEDRLGRGGSSTVYAGLDAREDRPVAIKVLDPEPPHRATERERLFREARLTAGLRHPNVVEVLDSGALPGGRGYLVMERLRGRTLARRMDECFWMPLEEVCGVGAQLLEALAAAHAVGVVHRDVKPANVFLLAGTGAPRVKLVDFGIARDLGDPTSRVTDPQVVVGTVGYMAPEQLFGDEPTVATDLYAAGATLYEMVAGRPPHDVGDGDIRTVLHAMVRPPPDLGELRPACPPRLVEGIHRALSKRLQDRPPSALAMMDACGLDTAAAA
ncbi:MAG TPA: serine/threonine-protein kinase [Sandaracinaceae bacterium LLY-WYZ-13_1]|nr:serine/threonine-protein kinase [Sandaracinaceae bacterium LLY-WYZ-13_1]